MPDTTPKRLPVGITPRLLCRDAAAAYCGVTGDTFATHVRPHVDPIEIGARRLWDIKALDRWLDEQSGLIEAFHPVEDWMERARRDRARARR